MSQIELSIIIINYKTPSLTLRCIESIHNTTKCNYEIIVVDNDSQDDSQSIICAAFPNVIWIQNNTNEGFGRANNKGVSMANGEYILLLNSDVLVQENTIDKCLEYLRNTNKATILACQLQNINGSIQNNLNHDIVDLNQQLNCNIAIVKIFGAKPTPNSICAISGAYMMMGKNIFDAVNGFDPDFFMYFEEIDLCRRINNHCNCEYKLIETVSAIHKHEGSSTGKLWNRRQRIISESLMAYKIYGYGGFALYHFLQFNTVTMNLVVSFFIKKYRDSALLHFKAYMKNLPMNIVLPLLYSRKPGTGKRLLKIQ